MSQALATIQNYGATANPSPSRLPATVRAPITLDYVEALKAYADVLYKGGLCPRQKGEATRAEMVAAILEVGKDIGLPPTQALANIRITNGRPAIFGDAALAMIRASGLMEDFEETTEGEPFADDFTAVCRVKRRGSARERVERFSVGDAKRAGLWGAQGPWTTAPKRMLMFRARGFALRDEFGDVLLGLIFAEEAEDIAAAERQPVKVVQIPAERVGQGEGSGENTPPLASPVLPAKPVEPGPVAARVEDRPGATREQLIERLVELRDSMFVSRSIKDATSDEAKAAWAEALAPFGVTTVKDLADDKVRELIVSLAKVHDPF